MTDLISRSEAIQVLKKAKELASEPPTHFDIYINKTFDLCIRLIAAFDAVDAVPVVHARWIYSGDMDLDGNSQGYCSKCGAGDKHRADLKNLVPYCWKCGAKMDAEEDR